MKIWKKYLCLILIICLLCVSLDFSFVSYANDSTAPQNKISSLLKKCLLGNSLSENSLSNNSLSENSLSENSLSDNSLSENSFFEEFIFDGLIPEASLSGNFMPNQDLSGNSVSEDLVSENALSVSENTASADDILTDTLPGNSSPAINAGAKKPKSYTITYNYNGGYLKDGSNPVTYTAGTTEFTFASPVRAGCYFGGWFADSALTVPISGVTKTTSGSLSVYAKWNSAKPAKAPNIKSVKNSSKGKAVVKYTASGESVSGYELSYSYVSSFKKNNHQITLKAKSGSRTLTNLLKGKTYYFKIRAYNLDSTGAKCYGSYSSIMSCKIKKGVTSSPAKSNSATLTSCKVYKKTNLYVKAKIPKRLKSSDDFYYLVQVGQNTNTVLKVIEKCEKTTTITFNLPLKKEDGTNLIQGKYAIAVKSGKKYKLVSKTSYITNPSDAATYTAAFPKTTSKKGLQGSLDTSLGVQHTFINIDLNAVLNGTTPYTYNGKTYYFNDAYGSYISSANKLGITISGQIMITWSEQNKYVILKSARTPGHSYYALNAEEKKARETLEAAFSFMAEKYSKSDCHLDNWILGNEVNIHNIWYYAGNISRTKFIKTYSNVFRILYYAVKSNSKNARVYICMDHTWSDRCGDWGARPFMDAFNKEIKSQQKNIQWNLAYHAYPSILTSAATWNDKYVSNDVNTEFVSPKNLSVLTNYVKKNFGTKTRIILSEQGFTSTSGYSVQAAAIVYTYYKAEFNSMIDSVIFRSDYDASAELAQGLAFGLCDLYGNHKPAYDVFKYMDTPKASTYTKKYLKTIGVSSWKKVVSGYTTTRFKKNVR